MPRTRLPRELAACINQLANDRAQGGGTREAYRQAYKQEKARLLAQVVTWLAAGKSADEVLKGLQARKRRRSAELQRTLRAIGKAIWEMP